MNSIRSELDKLIQSDTEDELYQRGYGEARFGSLNGNNDTLALLLVSAVLIALFWGSK